MLGLHRPQLQYLADPYVQPVSTPTLRATSTTGTTDAQSATVSVPIPAGAQAGDVVQVAIELWDSSATNPTITPPNGGWSLIVNYVSTTDGFEKLKIWQKSLLVAEAGNWVFSGFGSHFVQGQALAASGCDLTSPLDGAVSLAQVASGTAMPANSKTTTAADLMIHWLANENSSTQPTPPTGYTNRQVANYLKLNTKVQSGAGSETIAAGALSASTLQLAALFGLKPMASGAAMNLDAATGSGAAQALASSKALALGSATGSGVAQALAPSKALTLDSASGVGAPQAMTIAKGLALGVATGSGAAQAAGFTGAATMTLDAATGTGAPQPMAFSKGLALGVATGSGTPQALAP